VLIIALWQARCHSEQLLWHLLQAALAFVKLHRHQSDLYHTHGMWLTQQSIECK
jgi:hypothetical protein